MRLLHTLCAASVGWTLTAACAKQVVLAGGFEAPVQPVNVAIIGAGAAGSSAAYFLSNYAHSASVPFNITVFERNSYIGGRSTTVGAYNDSSLPVELGASIFVEVNKILADAVKEFNLPTTGLRGDEGGIKIPGALLAVWDGEKITLTQNGGWFDLPKLFWKYGTAPLKTLNLMKATVNKFLLMYDAPIFPFKSLTQAARDVGLLAVTAATGEQYMRENLITGSFGREVVQASTRVNYAQNLAFIHGLEAMVCMATEGAMAVEGGNWKIFENMIKASGATLRLDTKVGGIWPQNDGGYAMNWSHPDGTGSAGRFDTVILAAPYQFAELKNLGQGNDQGQEVVESGVPDDIPYVELHVTLFTSPHLISPTFLNLPPDEAAPQTILTTLPDGEPAQGGPLGAGKPGFWSISLLRPITNPETTAQEYLYKIFSPSPPNATFFAQMLGVQDLPNDKDGDSISPRDVTWIYRKVWHSYPYEYPRVTFEDIRLGEGLWYTSGMDSFISTMETNALMGKNVARLIVDEWEERLIGVAGLREG